jgi:predicted dehydrogenase
VKKRRTIKTILIGCGRIGAGSGGRRRRAGSHAGVLADIPSFAPTLYDPDLKLSKAAAEALDLPIVDHIDKSLLESCACAVICSPTNTHFEYLSEFLNLGIPLIVCEKPVCASMAEVKKLRELRKRSKSRVVVNYTRRFQPSFEKLKKRFAHQVAQETLRTISVRYQRGILNNASHALDLIQFLTGWDILSAKVHPFQVVCDEFPNDPTLSGHGSWNGVQLSILGLPNVQFSLFEIDFFFERSAIRLRDRGETIEFADADEPSDYYAPLAAKKNSQGNLQEPLKNLYYRVRQMIRNPELPDNFEESLKLTEWIFRTLNKARAYI